METLYVVEQGAYIRKNAESLDIVKKGQVLEYETTGFSLITGTGGLPRTR